MVLSTLVIFNMVCIFTDQMRIVGCKGEKHTYRVKKLYEKQMILLKFGFNVNYLDVYMMFLREEYSVEVSGVQNLNCKLKP